MKILIIPIVIFLLVVNSCKKDDTPIIKIESKIYAGISDSNFVFKEFNPPFKILFKTDSLNYYKYGSDSIDINSDGLYDLIIRQRFFMEGYHNTEISNNNYPFCSLTFKNGFEVANKKEIFPIGLGQNGSVFWVDTLGYKNRIDNLSNWTKSNTEIWMWVVPPTTFWGSNGCWYNLNNTEKYIGIRKEVNSKYKYGWIKMNQYSRENFEIISYAIEK